MCAHELFQSKTHSTLAVLFTIRLLRHHPCNFTQFSQRSRGTAKAKKSNGMEHVKMLLLSFLASFGFFALFTSLFVASIFQSAFCASHFIFYFRSTRLCLSFFSLCDCTIFSVINFCSVQLSTISSYTQSVAVAHIG